MSHIDQIHKLTMNKIHKLATSKIQNGTILTRNIKSCWVQFVTDRNNVNGFLF